MTFEGLRLRRVYRLPRLNLWKLREAGDTGGLRQGAFAKGIQLNLKYIGGFGQI